MATEKNPKIIPYIEGRDLFVEWCSKIEGAIPVEFGSVGCPGISDIDIGIVFKDTFSPADCDLRHHLMSFPEKIEILMNGGTLMFFPENTFKHILLIDDINVRFLTDDIDIKQNTSSEKYLVGLVQIIEWMPERILKIHLEIRNASINKKRLVGYFYSLCHSLKKIQTYTTTSSIVNDFVERIMDLRNKWFFLGQADIGPIIEEISRLCIGVFVEAVNTITPILLNHFKITKHNKLISEYNIYKNVNLTTTQDGNVGVHWSDDSICARVPEVFLCTYAEYSRFNSYLGSIINRRMDVKFDYIITSEEMRNILIQRSNILSSLFDFTKVLNCGTGAYKFGWYLKE